MKSFFDASYVHLAFGRDARVNAQYKVQTCIYKYRTYIICQMSGVQVTQDSQKISFLCKKLSVRYVHAESTISTIRLPRNENSWDASLFSFTRNGNVTSTSYTTHYTTSVTKDERRRLPQKRYF